jgi:hypothetical protein
MSKATRQPRPAKAPCATCPYRRDVAAGIWHPSEYAKLPAYDGETWEQAIAGAWGLFYCHQNDGRLCAGWVGCHDMRHNLAVRLTPVHASTFAYVSPVALFDTGAQAAAHGLAGCDTPDARALAAIAKLQTKRIGPG